MIKTLLVLGFSIFFFTLIYDEILPFTLSLLDGVLMITNGVTTWAFVIDEVWDIYPYTIKSVFYFWISYTLLKKVVLGG